MTINSPLYDIHKKLNAKFTDFAGYNMPAYYTSIKEEHLTVRRKVGLFDVSHMSNIWINGPDAEKLISKTTIEDASKIKKNMSQYTTLLSEDGTIIDDTIFMNLKDGYMIVPNAGMSTKVENWLKEKADEFNFNVGVNDFSKEFTILAIQGPQSRNTLQNLTKFDLNKIGFFGCSYVNIENIECIVSHTGYTGELGFELYIKSENDVLSLFNNILDKGKEYGIKPIGLGARDTLRIEKSFLLASNEFEGGRTPLEALLSWAINWDHDFIGKKALLKQKEIGKYERLTNLICIEKGIPRKGCEVFKGDEKVGIVSSGTLSPCLNVGIAIAYVKPDYRNINDILTIDIRGRKVKSKVIKPPFVKKDWENVK
jgi:aminomethyltransferase